VVYQGPHRDNWSWGGLHA